jgi:hypothetical protein
MTRTRPVFGMRAECDERIYITEVSPRANADAIIDNTDYASPGVVRW